MRRRRLLVTLLAAMSVVAGVVVVVRHLTRGSIAEGCSVAAPVAPYHLDLEQAANAATIAVVASRKGLPDHAVTVALAAALQESKLRNLTYGDRDSVGLFQQRPSQGWGTPEQLLQPRYAAAAFYYRLMKVPGWSGLPVASAAQYVQHSAAPYAYAQWEGEARALAAALTGEHPAALSCSFAEPRQRSTASFTAAVTTAFGPRALDVPVATKQGWTIAAWLVATAYDHGIDNVSFDGQSWSSRTGHWRPAHPKEPMVRVRRS